MSKVFVITLIKACLRPFVGTSLLAGNLSALPGTRILLRINLIMRLSFGGNFRIWPEISRNCEEPFHPNFGQKFDS